MLYFHSSSLADHKMPQKEWHRQCFLWVPTTFYRQFHDHVLNARRNFERYSEQLNVLPSSSFHDRCTLNGLIVNLCVFLHIAIIPLNDVTARHDGQNYYVNV